MKVEADLLEAKMQFKTICVLLDVYRAGRSGTFSRHFANEACPKSGAELGGA